MLKQWLKMFFSLPLVILSILFLAHLGSMGCYNVIPDPTPLTDLEVTLNVNVLGYKTIDGKPYATIGLELKELKGQPYNITNTSVEAQCDNNTGVTFVVKQYDASWIDGTAVLAGNATLDYQYDFCLDPKSYSNPTMQSSTIITKYIMTVNFKTSSDSDYVYFAKKGVDISYSVNPDGSDTSDVGVTLTIGASQYNFNDTYHELVQTLTNHDNFKWTVVSCTSTYTTDQNDTTTSDHFWWVNNTVLDAKGTITLKILIPRDASYFQLQGSKIVKFSEIVNMRNDQGAIFSATAQFNVTPP